MGKGREQGQICGGTDGGGDGHFNRGKEEPRLRRWCFMLSRAYLKPGS